MPDSPNSADTLGWAYYKQGVYNGAIDMFQQAITESKTAGGDNPTYHYHLGLAYQKANKRDLAKKELEYALKLNPSSTEANKSSRRSTNSAVSPAGLSINDLVRSTARVNAMDTRC